MRWIEQEAKARNCGQIALAVIADIDLSAATRMVGHSKGTNTKTLVRVLRDLGFSCPDSLRRMRTPPPLGIGKLRFPYGGSWHWVVVHEDRVFDGAYGGPDGTVLWPEGFRVTSYLPVER